MFEEFEVWGVCLEVRQEVSSECCGALARQQSGQVVDRDDVCRRRGPKAQNRLHQRRPARVDWQRVVRVAAPKGQKTEFSVPL